MLSLTLSAEERELLYDVLREAIADLRMEIADTDSYDYRTMLHRREELLKQLAARVAPEAETQTR